MDDETKWQRAYDLNVLNKLFTPMESAKNFYLRMTKFEQTTREISGEKKDSTGKVVKTSKQLTYARISQLVQLVKLPDEVQDLVYQGILVSFSHGGKLVCFSTCI